MSGDTAWIMTSAALVLLMVPGLALFYGGMVRSKNVLNMLNMNFYCLGIVPIIWAVVGMSIANGDSDRKWLGFFEFGEVWMQQPDGAEPRGHGNVGLPVDLRRDHACLDLWRGG